MIERVFSWPILSSVFFVVATASIVIIGEASLGYSVGQFIAEPIYAKVGFDVPDEAQTAANKEAASASTPSYFTLNSPALTFDRIRADLMRIYQAATTTDSIEKYESALLELKIPDLTAGAEAYRRVHALGDEAGRAQFQLWVDQLPLEKEYVVRDIGGEPREPKSTIALIRVNLAKADQPEKLVDIPLAELVPFGNQRALQRSAAAVARRFRLQALAPAVETVVLNVFREQPTLLFDRDRTLTQMAAAADAIPTAVTMFEEGKPFVKPGVLGPEDYVLLREHRAAYRSFLKSDLPGAAEARTGILYQRGGAATLVGILSIGLLLYAGAHQRRIFGLASRTVAFMTLILGTMIASRVLNIRWPDLPELIFVPGIVAGSVLAIVYPRRFAVGAACIMCVLVCTVIEGSLIFLLTLFVGVVVAAYQLDEIRSRTHLIASGAITAGVLFVASAAGGFWEGSEARFVVVHAMWAACCALSASFVVSGILPLIERLFRVATSLNLLEWRDPTRPLLQLLAREAPGTYNHSLVLGTLAESACTRIGANGLLAQVGALYHDIGKIHKADYFAENQTGQMSRHDNLAPTMSLLIILGHVKDGIEMAKEYKLPRVLHQFIEEHHGTTVVRYFHYMASEKQPRIASGKHDREVPEADFRYSGPKPRTRESAVLMLCDGVEGAVRALTEPTPSRIEGVVHRIVMDRLNDGQFDDCEITLKQIQQVEEALVKSLCGIYHGRVAYPSARKPAKDDTSHPVNTAHELGRSGARAG